VSALQNFADILTRNLNHHQLSKRIIILHTAEYTELAENVFTYLQSFFNADIKQLNTIFDHDLEKYIVSQDIFLLFYTLPWHDLKNYYAIVRPILTKYMHRSYIVRDCLHHFNHIYQNDFASIQKLHDNILTA